MKKSRQRFVAALTRSCAGRMRYRQRFEFLQEALTVRSNSPSAIAAVRQRFIHYCRAGRGRPDAPACAEILLLKKQPFPAIDRKSGAFCGDIFWHVREGDWQFLQKDNRLLVGFTETPGIPFVIIINRPGRDGQVRRRQRQDGKVPLKGGANFVNWEEIADLTFLIFVRRGGWLCLHAACVSQRGLGLLISGPSGSGKTTAALSLLRGGFTFHSDEITAIAPVDGFSPTVSGVMLRPRVRAQISSQDQSEKSVRAAVSAPSVPQALPAAVISSGLGRAVAPVAVLIIDPVRVRRTGHRMTPLDEQSALVALLGQVLDPTAHSRRKQIFDCLGRLVAMCRLFRLEAGSDIASLPSFIERHVFAARREKRHAR
jgi:hypothetical protein